MGLRNWFLKGLRLYYLDIKKDLNFYKEKCFDYENEIKEKDRIIKEQSIGIKDLHTELEYQKQYTPKQISNYPINKSFENISLSSAAMQKLIKDYKFETVLDVGAGSMSHSLAFAEHGKKVTAVDYGISVYYQQFKTDKGYKINKIIGDFNKINFTEQFDCVWASHILEHQPNVDFFLKKIISLTKTGGIISITVPPFKHDVVGGHVSFWNAGLILYRLVLCGIDCSSASVLSYGYNVSVIVEKKEIILEGIEYDCGDIRRIKKYLPPNLSFNSNNLDDPFDGNIEKLNW